MQKSIIDIHVQKQHYHSVVLNYANMGKLLLIQYVN